MGWKRVFNRTSCKMVPSESDKECQNEACFKENVAFPFSNFYTFNFAIDTAVILIVCYLVRELGVCQQWLECVNDNSHDSNEQGKLNVNDTVWWCAVKHNFILQCIYLPSLKGWFASVAGVVVGPLDGKGNKMETIRGRRSWERKWAILSMAIWKVRVANGDGHSRYCLIYWHD